MLLALVLAACSAAPAPRGEPLDVTHDASLPNVEYAIETVGTLEGALDLVERRAADGFFYVVSQTGIIEKWSRNGSTRATVLDLSARTKSEGERGMLGLDFRRTQSGAWEAFVSYTNLSGDSVITRFDIADDGTFDTSVRPAGTPILTLDQPYANHNGGDVQVGPDNMVYVAFGDGGSSNDPQRRAQDMDELFGKILRIDPTSNGYTIPADNPFVDDDGARPEIWSLGLRNPWRISFDRDRNLWVADVGQNQWEEVSVAYAIAGTPGGRGVNFGWSAWEGTHRLNKDVVVNDALMPVHEYPHEGGACSISGGARATGDMTPGRGGWYFFGDYCSGRLRAISVVGASTVAEETVVSGLEAIVSVNAVSSGLYVLSNGGRVSRLVSVLRP